MARRGFKKRNPPVGARPGALALPSDGVQPRARVMLYDAAGVEEFPIRAASELVGRNREGRVLWVDVQGLGDARLLADLGKEFAIHPLALADVVNVPQRPKIEQYEQHVLFIARMLEQRPGEVEQLTLFLGDGYVLTFQERYGDCFDAVRKRIGDAQSPIRSAGADYLAYALLDTVVDAYFPALERLAEKLDDLEDQVARMPPVRVLEQVREAKHALRVLRRAIWPEREALSQLLRQPPARVSPKTVVYFRDTYDHAVQITDVIENYRELASEIMSSCLAIVGNRTNEVMKVLTVIASIFIPLSFIAGVYGMNFDWMPGVHDRGGFWAMLSILSLVAFAMLAAFRRRGWLGAADDSRPADGDARSPDSRPQG